MVQISLYQFFVSQGLVHLGIGVLVSLFIGFLIIRPNLQGCVIAACLLPLPGMYTLYTVYNAGAGFRVMASSGSAVKPAEFAELIMYSMSSSFCGTLSTLVPALLLAIALLRAVSTVRPLAPSVQQVEIQS